MINLLPPEEKRELQAARVNVQLVRYNFLILIAFLFLMMILAFAYFYLTEQKKQAENTIVENRQKETVYSKVKADAEAFRSELGDAKKVLDSQVSYSLAVARLSALLPAGVTIKDSLTINSLSFTSPMTLIVAIKDQATAKELFDKLSSSKYISNLQKVKTSITEENTYTISVSFVLKKEIAEL